MSEILYKSIDVNCDAAQVAAAFRDEPHLFLLDSSLYHAQRGRYSMVGFAPFEIFQSKGEASLDRLKKRFKQYAHSQSLQGFPLTAGAVGFIGYDYGLYTEKIQLKSRDDLNLPDLFFGFYDAIITIDHLTGKRHITSTGLPEKSKAARAKKAREKIEYILGKLKRSLDNQGSSDAYTQVKPGAVRSNMTKPQYIDMVKKAMKRIKEGDIYQINLSQRFELALDKEIAEPLEIYHVLRQQAKSHFGGYFDAGEFQLISGSPERFLNCKDGNVETRPMKGTRPRGADQKEDEFFKTELWNSAKEKAELLMITDLMRNDLGRVCRFGSVRTQELRVLEEYQTVYQTTSTVNGSLKQGYDCFDLLKACFPGGSITGCPKISAMNIIEELEPVRRGAYTGSFGYINFNGDMDFNVIIRTLLNMKDKIYYHVGGGIVADSKPEQEYQETLIKARSMQLALDKLFFSNEPRHFSR